LVFIERRGMYGAQIIFRASLEKFRQNFPEPPKIWPAPATML